MNSLKAVSCGCVAQHILSVLKELDHVSSVAAAAACVLVLHPGCTQVRLLIDQMYLALATSLRGVHFKMLAA